MTTNTVHIQQESHHPQTIQIQQHPQTIQIHQSSNQSLANAQVCLDPMQLTDVDVRTNSNTTKVSLVPRSFYAESVL